MRKGWGGGELAKLTQMFLGGPFMESNRQNKCLIKVEILLGMQ